MPTLYKVLEKIINTAIRDVTALGSFPFLFLFILLLAPNSKIDPLTGSVFSGETYFVITLIILLVILEAICIVFKIAFFKHRPNKEDYINWLDKINSSSFPSSHMARATFVYLALAHFTTPFRAFLLYIVVILVGLSRILLKKHFFTDVIVGFLIGITFYIFLFLLYERF